MLRVILLFLQKTLNYHSVYFLLWILFKYYTYTHKNLKAAKFISSFWFHFLLVFVIVWKEVIARKFRDSENDIWINHCFCYRLIFLKPTNFIYLEHFFKHNSYDLPWKWFLFFIYLPVYTNSRPWFVYIVYFIFYRFQVNKSVL